MWEDLENVLELFIQPLQFALVFINAARTGVVTQGQVGVAASG